MNFKNRIFVLRHGESENNILGVESTDLVSDDYSLTKFGVEQIQGEIERYLVGGEAFELVFCSPFRRTVETARIVVEACGVEFIVEDRLHEVNIGDFNGTPYGVSDVFVGEHGEEVAFPNGESVLDVKIRFRELMAEIESKFENKKILLVTHGGCLDYFLTDLYPNFNFAEYWIDYNRGRKLFELT